MDTKKIVEQKELLNLSEKELLTLVLSLKENEEIIINDKYIKKVCNQDE